jgi:hypothetical protein
LRNFGLIALAAVVTGLVVGIVIANSGGSGKATTSVPELKPPPGTISNSGSTGATGSTGSTGAGGSGGSTTPTQTQTTPSQSSGGSGTPQTDTPQNNTSPPKSSPAGRFEQFCKDNPGAC